MSSKVHAACDSLGKPVRFFVTAGQCSDYAKALDLIEGKKMKSLLADGRYDAQYLVDACEKTGAIAVIPITRK